MDIKLQLHYNGKFENDNVVAYVNGQMAVTEANIDFLSMIELVKTLDLFGYQHFVGWC